MPYFQESLSIPRISLSEMTFSHLEGNTSTVRRMNSWRIWIFLYNLRIPHYFSYPYRITSPYLFIIRLALIIAPQKTSPVVNFIMRHFEQRITSYSNSTLSSKHLFACPVRQQSPESWRYQWIYFLHFSKSTFSLHQNIDIVTWISISLYSQ